MGILGFRIFNTLLIVMTLIFPIYRFVSLDKDVEVVELDEIKELRKWFTAFSLLMIFLLIISNMALLIYLS